MAKRFEVSLTDTQYAFLDDEASRSSVSIAELIRRAIDTAYAPEGDRRVHVISHTLGRRSGIALDESSRRSRRD